MGVAITMVMMDFKTSNAIMKKALFTICGTLFLSGCTIESVDQLDNSLFPESVSSIEATIVGFDPFDTLTKAALSTDGTFTWTTGDKLSFWPAQSAVFEGSPTAIAFKVREGGSSSASFVGNGWSLTRSERYYASVPYSEYDTYNRVTLDYQGQSQESNNDSGHVGQYNYMYGKTTVPQVGSANIEFVNLSSYNRFTIAIPDAFSDISFVSFDLEADSDIFANSATYDPSQDEIVLIPYESSYTFHVSLNNESGFPQTDGKLVIYAMMCPVQWQGMSITAKLTDTEGVIYSASLTPKSNQISNKSYGYAISGLEISGKVHPDNEIWYTSNDGQIIEVSDISCEEYGANVVSNTYSNGMGIVTFDGPVTCIGSRGFHAKSTLQTISLPSTVQRIKNGAFGFCFSLTTVDLPRSVTVIEEDSFTSYSTSLTCFEGACSLISSDRRCIIKDGVLIAFATNGLESYSVPEGITKLGANVFYQATTSSVSLPSTLQEISYGCFRMSRISSITIPDRVISIGSLHSTHAEILSLLRGNMHLPMEECWLKIIL